MRKKYLSALLFGALLFASAGTFTSCKDYDDDIKDLQEQINTIASSLDDLKAQVGDKGVTSVTVEGGKLIVVTNGQSVSYDLPAGTDMEEIEIKDGHLYVGGIDKGAVGGSNVTVNEDGVLLIDGEDAGLKVGTEVVIKDSTNGIYTITIGDQTIQLPMASTNITVSNTSGNYVFTCIDETDESKGIVWGKADVANDKWAGPKGPYVKDQLLVGQMNTITVDVLPVTYDLGAQELQLVDSEGNVAPVTVKAQTTNADGPINSGSRAANDQGQWDLSVEMTDDVTADNISTVFATKVNNAYKNVKYALSVNGSLVTGYQYVIDTQVKEENSNTYTLAWTDLYFGDDQVTTNSATVDLGETEFIVKNAKVYDYYIAIAEYDINDAAKIGVTVENNKITAPNTAAGETIDFIIRTADVNGKVVTPNGTTDTPLSVTFGQVEAGVDELATTTYKALPVATGKNAEIKINLENVFSGLSASEATEVTDIAWSVDNDNFLLAKGDITSADTYFTYLDANEDKIGAGNEAAVLDNVTNIKKVQYVKFAVAESSINNDIKPGKYSMTLKLTNTKTGEIRKVTVPVEITLPTFDELFAKVTSEDVWADGVGTLRMQDGLKLDYTIAFKPAGAAAFDTNFSIAYDKVDNKDIYNSIINGIVTLKDVVKDNKLKTNELGTVISYKINGKNGLTVKSDKFTTHVLTMFEGAKLVYYKDNVSLEKAQAAYTGGRYVIDPMVKDSKGNKQGLAIQFGESEKAFVNTQITFNNVILNAIQATLNKPTSDGVNRIYTVDGLGQGVTAGHDGDGVVIGGSYNGQSATLVVNCWDSNDIKTSFEIPFETVVK